MNVIFYCCTLILMKNILPIESESNLPNCSSIGCSSCPTDRMRQQCGNFCEINCKSKKSRVPIKEKSTSCSIPPAYVPCTSLANANDIFQSCCKYSKLPKDCTKVCRYDASVEEMREAFVNRKRCPLGSMEKFLRCASHGKNNTKCCEAKNVFKNAGYQCQPYCDPAAGGLGHLRNRTQKTCTAYLEFILRCHWAGV